MRTRVEKWWGWFSARAYSTYARAWLGFLSFSESSFFIVPPEALLLPMVAARPARWLWLGVYTALTSVFGAVFGYFIAFFFFDAIGTHIIALYHLENSFVRVGTLFERNNFWVMFTAAFTPIPFKVFVLAAGFFRVSFWVFFLACLLGRTLRYLFIAYAAALFGPHITTLALRYISIATFILAALTFMVMGWWLWL